MGVLVARWVRAIVAVVAMGVSGCEGETYAFAGAPAQGPRLACTAVAETWMRFEGTKISSLSQKGSDTVAINVDGKTAFFITGAAVKSATATGAPFEVLRDNERELVIVSLGQTLDTFVVNRTNGSAAWTKSRSSSIFGQGADVASIYFTCV